MIGGAFCLIVATFLWSTDLFFRYELLTFLDPVSLVFLEHLIILVVLCPIFLSSLIPLFKINRKYIFAMLFIGVGGSAVGTVAFSYAFGHLNPVVPIVLQKLQPFVAIVGAEFILREKHPKYFYVWALIAMGGAVLLSEPYLKDFVGCVQDMSSCLSTASTHSLRAEDPSGFSTGVAVGSALIAVVCWGLSTVFGRFVSAKIQPRDVTFLRVFFGFLTLFLWLIWLGTYSHVTNFVVQVVLEPWVGVKLLYMALVVGLAGLVFYYQGIRHIPAKLATLLELFYPMFSLILATVFLHQSLNWIQILGMGLIVGSSTLCTLRGFK